MSIAYLGLGSNIDAEKNIASGIRALREAFDKVEISPVYQTPSFGFEGEDFINLAARVETGMGPLQLKQFLNGLEDDHGRSRDVPKYSDRTLDVDILLFDDLYLLSPVLKIPRDEILTAVHVLKPLADLAPDFMHPVVRKTLAEIWDAFAGQKTGLQVIEL